VTVLAETAAAADAAATVIANAVDVPDARIVRRPARELKDDSDLGEIPVTVDVPPLEPKLVQQALHAGLLRAQALQREGLIWSAALVCQQQVLVTDTAETELARRTLEDREMSKHSCHTGLDPVSMQSGPWIADQVRNDSHFTPVLSGFPSPLASGQAGAVFA